MILSTISSTITRALNNARKYPDNMGAFMEDMEETVVGKIDYVTLPSLMRSKNDGFRDEVLREVVWVYEV